MSAKWAGLEGKVVLVTGGARGIGRSIAKAFAAQGANVAVVDVLGELGSQVVQEINELGSEGIFIQADLRDESSVKKAVCETVSRFGKIDVLVNNAAALRFGSILTVAERDWDLVLTVNLKSPVFLMKAVANHMIERNGRGAIINIASIDGLVAEYGSIPYSASKAGMIHATKCAAVELAPYRINVNAIAPGTIKTELVKEQLTEKRVEALKRRVPWPEVGTPEDISGIAVFLASPLAGYVTGAVVVADGGWTVDGTAR